MVNHKQVFDANGALQYVTSLTQFAAPNRVTALRDGNLIVKDDKTLHVSTGKYPMY